MVPEFYDVIANPNIHYTEGFYPYRCDTHRFLAELDEKFPKTFFLRVTNTSCYIAAYICTKSWCNGPNKLVPDITHL